MPPSRRRGRAMKACRKCGETKPLMAFSIHSRYKDKVYRKNTCGQCDAVRRLRQHNERKNEPWMVKRKRCYAKKCYKKTQAHGSEGRAWRHLRLVLKRRGLTLDQFHSFFENQDFSCAICGDELVLGGKLGAHVDHCHATGVVRGILCAKCNLGVGHFNDEPSRMVAASRYVSKWKVA